MKYDFSEATSDTAVIEIIPTTPTEAKMLKSLSRDNINHHTFLAKRFGQALKKVDSKAVLVHVKDFVEYPTRALCTYELT